MGASTNTNKEYRTRDEHWERLATVRKTPRRVIEGNADGKVFYPVARQPICVHPKVLELGPKAREFILVQSFYKFMNDISMIETQVVSRTALALVHDSVGSALSASVKRDLMSIVVDEAYHAYVALDMMHQVENVTGVSPIELPRRVELQEAMQSASDGLSEADRAVFEAFAVCIAENSITSQLVQIHRDTSVNASFHLVNADHMSDEGRHSAIFGHVMKELWTHLEAPTKETICRVLPLFLVSYLSSGIQSSFDVAVLTALNRLDEASVKTVAEDTHPKRSLRELHRTNPILNNILSLLHRTEISLHPAAVSSFRLHGITLTN